MTNQQAQTGNDILNYLCRFINNKPLPFSKIARELKQNIHEVEEVIEQMMHIHPEWYSVQKKMFAGKTLMLNATALKEIHKFLVFGGHTNLGNAVPAKNKDAKEEKTANVRNTVIITPRLDLNHS